MFVRLVSLVIIALLAVTSGAAGVAVADTAGTEQQVTVNDLLPCC
ncbi:MULTISPECIES: hypothetical protein [Streptomyces]|jgi:hypothetical protein|nr:MULTISPECIES: hypothetical protein [Streptomyces]GGR95503.1 hypothetical protein GCM10010236_57580 [Streptomyces eurythermus]